jgi:hypothetical protein
MLKMSLLGARIKLVRIAGMSLGGLGCWLGFQLKLLE